MKFLFLFFSFSVFSTLNAQFNKDSVTFFFDYDSSIPLEKNFSFDASISELRITAYSDTSGTDEYNKKLAQRRADAVKNLFPNSLLVEQTTVVGESSKFGNAELNRRVDVTYKVPVKGILEREVLNLNIQFVGNQAVVLSKSYYLVDELIAKIKANTYTKIELHGHVCCSADLALSQKRAFAIQSMLVENGVDVSIIECFGHSNLSPLVPEYNEDDQAKNRRVEVVLIRSEMKY